MLRTDDVSNQLSSVAETRRFRWRMRNGINVPCLEFVKHRRNKLLGEFLVPENEQNLLRALPKPELMMGVCEGAERLVRAIENNEKIFVYADYDVDGLSAAAMVRTFFRELNFPIEIYIPDRFSEGYGLNPTGVDRIHSQGGSVIVTVDNGISAQQGCLRAQELGIDVVVTDHHDVPPELPVAMALLNPKQKDCAYPYKGLAGVGVAFQLLAALRAKLREISVQSVRDLAQKMNLRQYLDFVALGTIADMAPLDGVNHILCKTGLLVLRENIVAGRRPGVAALLELAGWKNDRPLSSDDVGFQIGPRLNAAGRLGSAYASEEILHTTDTVRARHLAQDLDAENRQRQTIERATTQAAIEKVEGMSSLPNAIVVGDPAWNPGVVGLVASRLVERYYRPTLVFGENNGKLRFSGRSTHAVDLFGVLDSVRDQFLAFGGHYYAIGLTLESERIDWLINYVNTEVGRIVSSDDRLKPLDLDAEISLESLDKTLLSSMEILEPFGVANPRPKWLVRNAEIVHVKRIGKDRSANHARILLNDGTSEAWLTAFTMAEDFESAHASQHRVDVVVDGRMQVWNGERRTELRLLDCNVRRH